MLPARETPLPEGIDLKRLFAGLPAQSVEDPQVLLISDWGKAIRAEGSSNPPAENKPPRAPNLAQPAKVDYPIVRAQAELAKRLRAYFTVNRALSIACAGNRQ